MLIADIGPPTQRLPTSTLHLLISPHHHPACFYGFTAGCYRDINRHLLLVVFERRHSAAATRFLLVMVDIPLPLPHRIYLHRVFGSLPMPTFTARCTALDLPFWFHCSVLRIFVMVAFEPGDRYTRHYMTLRHPFPTRHAYPPPHWMDFVLAHF